MFKHFLQEHCARDYIPCTRFILSVLDEPMLPIPLPLSCSKSYACVVLDEIFLLSVWMVRRRGHSYSAHLHEDVVSELRWRCGSSVCIADGATASAPGRTLLSPHRRSVGSHWKPSWGRGVSSCWSSVAWQHWTFGALAWELESLPRCPVGAETRSQPLSPSHGAAAVVVAMPPPCHLHPPPQSKHHSGLRYCRECAALGPWGCVPRSRGWSLSLRLFHLRGACAGRLWWPSSGWRRWWLCDRPICSHGASPPRPTIQTQSPAGSPLPLPKSPPRQCERRRHHFHQRRPARGRDNPRRQPLSPRPWSHSSGPACVAWARAWQFQGWKTTRLLLNRFDVSWLKIFPLSCGVIFVSYRSTWISHTWHVIEQCDYPHECTPNAYVLAITPHSFRSWPRPSLALEHGPATCNITCYSKS